MHGFPSKCAADVICGEEGRGMKSIVISNGQIEAVILPDFGGTVAHLKVNGTEILRMDEGLLGVSNTLAGGIPVLFPFVSATPGNEAVFRGESYTMPNHGFAKDLPFDIVSAESAKCEILLKSTEVTRRYYPYEFEFRLIYEIIGNEFKTTMAVKNAGDVEMPFAAGFHPYFLTPDREKTRFSFGLKEYWNYLRCDESGRPLHGVQEGELKLADEHDTVFFNGCADCEIICDVPRYTAKIECGESFDVITICTNLENASCVEPWQARPGAAHRQDECQKLKAGEEKAYSYSIYLS